jgi:hypothetical protein
MHSKLGIVLLPITIIDDITITILQITANYMV